MPTLKNRFFHGCFSITFCAMVSNIVSTVMIDYYQLAPLWATWTVTMIYFIFTPLMGMIYYFYAVAVVYEGRPGLMRMCAVGLIPGLLYLLLVFANPFTKDLFDIDSAVGYVQGRLIAVTYLVFYLYCIVSFVMVLIKRKWLGGQTFHILASFPAIALLVILIQQVFPMIILSGSAATCALLIIYLHLQNKQISIDYLTNVPNRQELINMMEFLMGRKGPAFAVMVVSLRDFKQVNDVFGQQNGDELLRSICQYLTGIARPKGLYRFNGDEFALLFTDTDKEEVDGAVGAIMARMNEPWECGSFVCSVRAVIGIAHYPISAVNLESLVNGMEYAVAKAKKSREENVCYCGPSMLNEIHRKHQVLKLMEDKSIHNDFDIHYQPIISTYSGQYRSAESLMRIGPTAIGPVYPDEFIPAAEESGSIIPITYLLLDRVCKFVNRLLDMGVEIEGIHVNFSAVQFSDSGLTEKICAIIRENHTPFSKIIIEFTETAIAENPQLVSDFAQNMRQLGIRTGLDDFGTGYSNMESVINIPFDTVKLDKSLIWSAMDHEKSAVMVKGMTGVFHQLGMQVLAEGVETEEQNRFVMDCGVDMIQGYYFARPMPEKETEEFFNGDHPAQIF